jgi:hypothetical protein
MKKLILLMSVCCLAACMQKDNGARVSSQKPVAKAAVAPKAVSRSEPVFYNGKTYQMSMTPQADGIFDMTVNDMNAGQQKDAVAVATSSLRYFGCAEGKTGKLTNAPTYVEGSWKMSARCA